MGLSLGRLPVCSGDEATRGPLVFFCNSCEWALVLPPCAYCCSFYSYLVTELFPPRKTSCLKCLLLNLFPEGLYCHFGLVLGYWSFFSPEQKIVLGILPGFVYLLCWMCRTHWGGFMVWLWMWKETTAKPHSLAERCRAISFAKANRKHAHTWLGLRVLVPVWLTQHLPCIHLGLLHSPFEGQPELAGEAEVSGSELWSLTPQRTWCFRSCYPSFWAR